MDNLELFAISQIIGGGGQSGLQLPDAPTTDGKYMLTCTVSGETVTLAWEAVTP